MEALTYSSYLKIEELLSLQQPQSEGPEHDEMLFIIIHQVYELWFKEILHELDFMQVSFGQRNAARVLQTTKRVLTIVKTMVAQIDVLETMTPLDFLTFRERLGSASGFQSFQFRELEFLLGFKRPSALLHYPEGSTMRQRLEKRYQQLSLWDAFLHFLADSGAPIPESILTRDVTQPIEPSPEVQQCLIGIYRTDLGLTQIC